MKALSVKQPWAYLIVAGYKDIENRTWHTKIRERIYIHAGKEQDDARGCQAAFNILSHIYGQKDASVIWKNYHLEKFFGALIGEVDIVDCVTFSASPWWDELQYGFVLADAVIYDKPIPYRGHLGLFEVTL